MDGEPIESRPFSSEAAWQPQLPGFSKVSLVDVEGHPAEADVRIVAGEVQP